MGRAHNLSQLAACLAGKPPVDCDWTGVLGVANDSLVTPALAAALIPAAEQVPASVRGFLQEVLVRNRGRNRRLRGQLSDAVAALNAAGIEPVLLKGAAGLVSGLADRLLCDLDLLVAPSEGEAAVRALEAGGFSVLRRQAGAAPHVVAELGRPQDVGCLDLHQRPPGPPAIADTPALAARRRPVRLGEGRALIPDPAGQVLYLVLHDQFHDGDYWRGGFDLRHLLDLAGLLPQLGPDDWVWLRAACGTALVRRALEAEALAAARLAGAAVPAMRPAARWTLRRWRAQHAWPVLRLPLAAAALALELPDVLAHRAIDRRGRKALLGETRGPQIGAAARLARLRQIMTLAAGKV